MLFAAVAVVELWQAVSDNFGHSLYHVCGAKLGCGAVDFGEKAEALIFGHFFDALGDFEVVKEVDDFFDVLGIVPVGMTSIIFAAALELDHADVCALCSSIYVVAQEVAISD